MFNLFKVKPLLNDADAQWMFDTFQWAMTHFDKQEFYQRSRLIEPTDHFFPSQVDSYQAAASSIFSATLNFTGLAHWPIQLVHPEANASQPPTLLNLDFSGGIQRNSSPIRLPSLSSDSPLVITYNLNQTLKPGDLSASFAHYIAQHMVAQSQQLPVGGKEYFAQSTEVVAVFMGFGILMANSAYTFRGSCGRCYNADANRHASLSEDKMVFALALFCRLKDIDSNKATKHLKKYLRGYFKQAIKQIDTYSEQFNVLAQQHEMS